MEPRTLWPDDPTFVEIGLTDAQLALCLSRDGYSKYLGVGRSDSLVRRLAAAHPELADRLAWSRRRKLALNNNAEALILSGRQALNLWRFRAVRHAKWVVWRAGFGPLALVALLGCLLHVLPKHYGWPRIVKFRLPSGKTRRMWVSRVLRRKTCRRKQLHFIPHRPGLAGFFRRCDKAGVRYVVLRWFESLPDIDPDEDVDLLVADESFPQLLEILESEPGILPCDVYSESGLARSDYCGTPYYPAEAAKRLLDGSVRHRGLCMVPDLNGYFHSLAYHAAYHKGLRSGIPPDAHSPAAISNPEHDYQRVLREMADELGLDVELTLEGLHARLQRTGWGPSPEMLARLASACRSNAWLQTLAARGEPHVRDQGLTVFVLRRRAIECGFQQQIVRMIEQHGFEILAARPLPPAEIEYAAARTRGGTWEEEGPFDLPSGPPAFVVVAYDRHPLPLSRRQRRKFSQRTNARIFAKEAIRDAIIAQLPPKQSFNALHSSDHAAEAWHLIEVLAPDILEAVRVRLREIRAEEPRPSQARRAA